MLINILNSLALLVCLSGCGRQEIATPTPVVIAAPAEAPVTPSTPVCTYENLQPGNCCSVPFGQTLCKPFVPPYNPVNPAQGH